MKVNCIKEIQTTYRDVLSPVYIQNKINMAASNRDKDSDIIDNRLLVAYDIETNESQVLFESHYESADIQSIDGNSNWLIFKDIDSIGVQEDFYFMDMKTKSIKELDLNQQESPSFSIPVLFENNIFWINEESVNNDINITVKKYDCISDKVDIISQINNDNQSGIYLKRSGNQLLWNDNNNNQCSYYIYNIDTQTKEKVPATLNSIRNPALVGDYIVSGEAKNKSDIHETYIYNTKTKEGKKSSTELRGCDAFRNLVLSSNQITSLYSINEDLSVTSKYVFQSPLSNSTITNEEYITFHQQNDKGVLLSIYALDDK